MKINFDPIKVSPFQLTFGVVLCLSGDLFSDDSGPFDALDFVPGETYSSHEEVLE